MFAHPDDAELSCFGSLALLVRQGWKVGILHVTRGEFSESPRRHQRPDEAEAAAKIIGARHLVVRDSFGRSFDDGHLRYDGSLIGVVEEHLRELKPEIVLTHFPQDGGFGHQDHHAVGHAVTNAAVRDPSVRWLLQAEPPATNLGFSPNLFVDITAYVDMKLKAIRCYESERHKPFMQDEVVLTRGRWWAQQAAADEAGHSLHVEPFVLVKGFLVASIKGGTTFSYS